MSYNNGRPGQVFSASFVTTALSTAGPHDLFVLTSTAASRVAILDIEIGQLSTAPGCRAGARITPVARVTGSAGGAAVGPVNLKGWSGAPAAVSGVTQNSSSVISTTSAVLLHAASLSGADGTWRYEPVCPPELNNNTQRAHLNITTPNVAVALHGTVTFAEYGKPPTN